MNNDYDVDKLIESLENADLTPQAKSNEEEERASSFLVCVGFLLCLTVIGAIIGIPLICMNFSKSSIGKDSLRMGPKKKN